MKNRKDQIVKLLLKEGKVRVKELSERFSVSEVSIRKDLTDLEEEGKIKRVHGGAVPLRNRFTCKDLEDRKSSHQDEKYSIAEKSYEIIQDGDVVYLDSSSINILLAQIIVIGQKSLTIVTNMLEVINILSANKDIAIYALPGFLSTKAGGFVSSNTKNELMRLNIDKAFVGCSGFDINKGQLSTDNCIEGELKKTAIEEAREAYIILEKAKFETYDLYNFISIDSVSNVISVLDQESSERLLLEELDIKIY